MLEVVIALAIFLFSMAALSHLMSMSGSRALDGYIRSQATLRCQSKLAEVIAGAVPLHSSSWSAFDDDADWSWRLDCEQGAAQGLWNVHVWVQKKRPDGSQLETTISQIVLAPAQRGSTLQDPGTAPATTTPATDSTSGTTSESTTGSTGTTENSDE